MRRVQWLLIVLAGLVLVGLGLVQYGRHVSNPQVVEEITTDPDGARAGIVMLLRLPDGRELPVNYLREGSKVFVGADGPWWRQFSAPGAPVELLIRGQSLRGFAQVELQNPDYVADVFSRLRPTAPTWLPAWLNGRLIVISLEH